MALFGGHYMDKQNKRDEKVAAEQEAREREEERWLIYNMRKDNPELFDFSNSPRMCELRNMFTMSFDMGVIGLDEANQLIMLKPYKFIDLYYFFNEIRGYELLENNAQVTKGGFGGAVLGGALLGGAGAVAGSILGKNSKTMVENLFMRFDTMDIESPCIYVNFIDEPVPVASARYRSALEAAHNALSRLNLVLGKDENSATEEPPTIQSPMNPYDEIKQLKELLDIGAISQEEFDIKKRMLLGL